MNVRDSFIENKESDQNLNGLNLQMIHCGDAQGDLIEKTLKSFEDSSGLKVKRKKDHEQKESFLSIGANIKVKAQISGKIRDMVIDILASHKSLNIQRPQFKLEQNVTPFFLNLFITHSCPHCPAVVKGFANLALMNSNIYLDVIDGLLYENISQEKDIKAAPTLVLNDNFMWTGQIDINTVVEVMEQQDPKKLSKKALLTLIEMGRASAVAEMMLERRHIFNSLIDLLLDDKWSVRLGAMVVAEDIGSHDPDLGINLMKMLWQHFDSIGDTVKGDIIYLAGTIGDSSFIPRIQDLIEEVHGEELMEVAAEAVQSLKEKFEIIK